MKVLQVCLRVPFPPSDGGTIAMYNLGKSLLHAGADLKVLAFNTEKHFVDDHKISSEYKLATEIEAVYLNASVNIIDAFLNLFSKKSYNITRFVNKTFSGKLVDILRKNNYDVVQLESLFVTPYLKEIRANSKAKIVLRAHNMEYVVWQRLAKACKNPFKRAYLKMLANRLERYEQSLINEYDAIVVLTPEDKKLFEEKGCNLPIHIAPIGVDVENYKPDSASNEFSVFHLGSMNWMPNIEAVDWFLHNCWDQLKEKNPAIKLHIAGKEMPQRFKDKADKNLIVYDVIDDAKKFMSDKPVMIAPLLSGGGMRVKIIEGMAMGKGIISTTIGAEGINYTENANILIADTPQKFIDCIVQCKENPAIIDKIGRNARLLAENYFDNKKIGEKLFRFYKQIIA